MGESKTSAKKAFIQHDNKILAFVQTILKSMLCVLGWHAFLTVGLPLRMKMNNPDRFDNFVEYEHTEFAFLLSFNSSNGLPRESKYVVLSISLSIFNI